MSNLTQIQQIFDEFLSKNGLPQRLDLDLMPESDSKDLISSYKQSAQSNIDWFWQIRKDEDFSHKEKFKPIHVEIVNSPLLNAFATEYNGHYFIGINSGTILLLMNFFNRLLSDSSVLREIGNPDWEEEIEAIPLTNNYNVILDHYKSDPPVIPVDPQRAEHACVLTTFALDFLLYHEFHHIYNGHLSFKRERLGMPFFMEYKESSPRVGTLVPMDIQVLEVDADRNAAEMSINFIWNVFHGVQGSYEFTSSYEDKTLGLLYNWSLAIWVLFRLTDLSQNSNTTFKESNSYPTILYRQLHSIHWANIYLNDWMDNREVNLPTFNDIHRNIIKEAEIAISAITKKSINSVYTENMNYHSTEYNKALNTYGEYWQKNVYSDLVNHCWVNLIRFTDFDS